MTQVNMVKVKIYAIRTLERVDGDPYRAIGSLTMQMERHKRGVCKCGNTVEFLQEVIDCLVYATYGLGDES